jgi:uncharacterized glyoxalase superfamily protein PhnB
MSVTESRLVVTAEVEDPEAAIETLAGAGAQVVAPPTQTL